MDEVVKIWVRLVWSVLTQSLYFSACWETLLLYILCCHIVADGMLVPGLCRWATLCCDPLDLSKIFRVFIKLVLKFMVYSDNLHTVRRLF